MQRARRYAKTVLAGGVMLVVFQLWLADKAGFLVSPFVFALALTALGGIAAFALGHMSRRIRSDADDVADVVAVHLCKNPIGLGRALDRIGADHRRVTHNSWRAELLWFETTEEEATADAAVRGGREIDRRAVAAYATANEQRPAEAAAAIAAATQAASAAVATAGVPHPGESFPIGAGGAGFQPVTVVRSSETGAPSPPPPPPPSAAPPPGSTPF